MPEIWTLSGINNQQRANGPFTDYMGDALLQGISSLKPKHIARRYASRLGCLKHYPDPCNVLCLQPDKLLNDEAQTIAIGLHEVMRGVKVGEFNGRNIHVILLAPKTNKHPKTQPTELQIYWGSYDAVPNQGIFSSDSLSFWRKWTKHVYPLSATHAIGDYLVAKPKIVKRTKVRLPNHKPTSPRYRYKWTPTGQTAPNVLQTVESWLTALPDDDLVLVGHSQGTNIAMHLLARGMA